MPSDLFTTILPADRDPDGYYMMLNGQTQCLPFRIKPGECTALSFDHTHKMAQDYSLRCWFSATPNSMPLFTLDDVDIFAMGRAWRRIEVWDEALRVRGDERLLFPVDRDCWFNVQNLQNSMNGYRLDISF